MIFYNIDDDRTFFFLFLVKKGFIGVLSWMDHLNKKLFESLMLPLSKDARDKIDFSLAFEDIVETIRDYMTLERGEDFARNYISRRLEQYKVLKRDIDDESNE